LTDEEKKFRNIEPIRTKFSWKNEVYHATRVQRIVSNVSAEFHRYFIKIASFTVASCWLGVTD